MKVIFESILDWKTYNKYTYKKISKLLKISEIYAYLLCRNKRRPSPELAKKINGLTNISIENLLHISPKKKKVSNDFN